MGLTFFTQTCEIFLSRPLEQTVVELQHNLLLFSTDGVKLEKKPSLIVIVNYILSKLNNSKYAYNINSVT